MIQQRRIKQFVQKNHLFANLATGSSEKNMFETKKSILFTEKDYEQYDCEQCRSDAKARRTYMILCPDCGNKRCPQAENHRFQCTKSNATDQVGTLKLEFADGNGSA